MKHTLPLLALIVFSTSPVSATEERTLSDAASPALIQDTTVRTTDSPLVAAAKRIVAARKNSPTSPVVIDNNSVRNSGGRISQGTTQAPLESGDAQGPPPSAAESKVPQDPKVAAGRAAAAKKVEGLKKERERMAAEGDEPYGGDVEEGRAEQRNSQIPGEMSAAQKAANPTPAKPPL